MRHLTCMILALAATPSLRAEEAAAPTKQVLAEKDKGTELEKIVVTANPFGSSLFELVTPVQILSEEDLLHKNQSTLGETLAGTPGISSSYFGPNASRPVIRGQDGDRIRIMQNGIGSLDASALSPDHASTIDPLILQQVEVVRGPAALLYGGSAVGGVVNTIDNRIPTENIDGVHGKTVIRAGGPDKQKSGAVVLEAGGEHFAIHADAYQRSSENLTVPGNVRSDRLRKLSPEENEPKNEIPNSAAENQGGAFGASALFSKGYVGLSYAGFKSDYGTVAEETVKIQMRSARTDFATEVRDLGPLLEKAKLRIGQTEYKHQELEDGEVGTIFKNKGYETSLELTHRPIGAMKGVVGIQTQDTGFEALGDEAFLPKIDSRSRAAFLFEEIPAGDFKFTFGGRVEDVEHEAKNGGPEDANVPGTLRFGGEQTKSFDPHSLALGGLYTIHPGLGLSLNVSSTQRAPTYSEVFANGPHLATGQYELGNKDLSLEKSNQAELTLRWKSGANNVSFGGFYNRFEDYIALINSGNERLADGTLNPAIAGADDEVLPEYRFSAIPAVFYGSELESNFRLIEGSWSMDLGVKGDYIFAKNRDNGQPLPRIAPYHIGVSPELNFGALSTRLDLTYAGKQSRVADNELPTDGYTMLDLSVNYAIDMDQRMVEIFAKANNLLDAEARVHSSVLKDIAPLSGRGLLVGLKASI